MEDAIRSVISQWKKEFKYKKPVPADSITIKYADHEAGIYTLYLRLDPIVKIKAIRDLSAWKIINMS